MHWGRGVRGQTAKELQGKSVTAETETVAASKSARVGDFGPQISSLARQNEFLEDEKVVIREAVEKKKRKQAARGYSSSSRSTQKSDI